jgi:hypothetical protein
LHEIQALTFYLTFKDEPIEGVVQHTRGPPSIPSDDAFTLDELPFWRGGESMEFEVESE